MIIFTKADIRKEVLHYAVKLQANARLSEPTITADLQAAAALVSAEIVGLENRFKSLASLTEKINHQAAQFFEYSLFENIPDEKTLKEIILQTTDQQNDTLRYTFLFPIDKYVFGFKQTLYRNNKAMCVNVIECENSISRL